jgi:hypothetical protein
VICPRRSPHGEGGIAWITAPIYRNRRRDGILLWVLMTSPAM